MKPQGNREEWGTRVGLILAAAGNAVGIGNLLRFPSQAAQNGGGAFMIPYVISLILFGLPLMWIAWTVGRMGCGWGHGTMPGIFDRMGEDASGNRRWWPKYLGVLGVAMPLAFVIYYTYIEAWCLAYAFFSLTGSYADKSVDLQMYFEEFLGNAPTANYFPGVGTAFTFLGITLIANVIILYRGVSKGIELLAKVAIPLLVAFCLLLGVRVLTLGTIEGGGSPMDGLEFMFKPDFSALGNFQVWMAAAGQIFFTLSIGFGALECYGSYLKRNDDITLTGLTTASANEFVEVFLGSMIAIPAAAAFYGKDQIQEIANSGTFNIGMVSMPEILRNVGGVSVFGTLWFSLLFFAAFTSSVAVAQPVMAFLQDEAKLNRSTATGVMLILWFLGSLPVVFLYKYGSLGELDAWAGTIGLVVFAMIEIVMFAWIFGIHKGWAEMHMGADIQVPIFFKHIMMWVTPIALIVIFVGFVSTTSFTPTPSIHSGPMNVKDLGGLVRFGSSDVEDAADVVSEVEGKISGAVDAARRDLRGWASVTVNPSAPLRVSHWTGDPDLVSAVTAVDVERWLRARGMRFEDTKGAGGARPVQVTFAIEGRHRVAAIWAVRGVMFSFVLGFTIMIWAIWRRRSMEAA